MARRLGNIAESVLDDLDGIVGPDFDAARAFSKELNDTFTRTFAGGAMAKGGRGDRVPAELMLEKALASGGTKGAMQMNEIDLATKMADRAMRALDDNAPELSTFADEMIAGQERIIRLAAAAARDPETGVVSAKRLAKFVHENGGLMKRFPEIKKDLDRAINTQRGMEDVQRAVTHASRRIEDEVGFARIAGYDNAVDAVNTAMGGVNAPRKMVQLIKLAKRGGDTTLRGGMDAAMVARLKGIIGEAMNLNTASKASGRADESFPGAPNMMMNAITRISGSAIAGWAVKKMGGGGGNSLIVARTGSSAGQRIMDKVPQLKITDLLIEAMLDKDMYKVLMAKGANQKETFKLRLRMHSYLFQAGLTAAEDSELPDIEEELPTVK